MNFNTSNDVFFGEFEARPGRWQCPANDKLKYANEELSDVWMESVMIWTTTSSIVVSLALHTESRDCAHSPATSVMRYCPAAVPWDGWGDSAPFGRYRDVLGASFTNLDDIISSNVLDHDCNSIKWFLEIWLLLLMFFQNSYHVLTVISTHENLVNYGLFSVLSLRIFWLEFVKAKEELYIFCNSALLVDLFH